MQTPAWVPAATRIGLIVWALMAPVYGIVILAGTSAGSSFFFTVDSIAFRLWVAGLGLLGLAAIVAQVGTSSRRAKLPGWLLSAFVIGILLWLLGSAVEIISDRILDEREQDLAALLDVLGFRIAVGALGYGTLLWFAAPPAAGNPSEEATAGSS